jgi:hypothetical protein
MSIVLSLGDLRARRNRQGPRCEASLESSRGRRNTRHYGQFTRITFT